MTNQTKIEWTDFTVNFWEGCQKVGPGCDNCYAEARDVRFTGGSHWGPGAPRRLVKGGIAKLRKINRDAGMFYEEMGRWPRVFCSSLSDMFDNAVNPMWRREAFEAIEAATDTRVQMLTKRVKNVGRFVPGHWRTGKWPSHVGLMITVVNQAEADRDIPKLLDLKARLGIPWVGISYEPALGPIDWKQWLPTARKARRPDGTEFLAPHFYMANCPNCGWIGSTELCGFDSWGDDSDVYCPACNSSGCDDEASTLDWVICGGESGPNARPMHPDWARSVRDQCEAAGVPFLFKQWGEWQPYSEHDETSGPKLYFDPPETRPDATRRCRFDCLCMDSDGTTYDLGRKGGFPKAPSGAFAGPKPMSMFQIGKARAGRLLDGREWNEFPEALS